jgi:hypothetical protein
MNDKKRLELFAKHLGLWSLFHPKTHVSSMKIVFTKLTNIRIIFKIVPYATFFQ